MQMEMSQRKISFKIDWFLQLQQDGRMMALLKRSGHPLDLASRVSKGDSGHCAAQQARLVQRICNDP